MISTFTLMGCSQTLFAWNPRIRTSLFNTFHLCDQIGLPWNNLFSNCIVWTDHTLNIMQKETNYLLVMPFERSIFLLASKKKSIFYCFGSNQLFGKFHSNFPFNNYVAFNYTSNIQFPICCPTVAWSCF